MMTSIWIALVILVAFLIIANRPAEFRVERSTVILAPPERIKGMVDNFHNWNQWAPWAHLDPLMVRNFSGPPAGAGAVYEWEGDASVGRGRMEVLECHPGRTSVRMNFEKPFKVDHVSEFVLTPERNGTRVTWALHGPGTVGRKILNLMTGADRRIGEHLVAGLQSLKVQSESCLGGRPAMVFGDQRLAG